MGDYTNGIGLSFSPQQGGLGGQIGIGAAALRQGLGALDLFNQGIPTIHYTSYERFHAGCQRLIDEIKRRNKDNCIKGEIDRMYGG